ncbi:MFS transporter [Diaminobutyricimonas sp. TR449]|uniref:MFS transporter n=1 Tax=Diaminobutyricimonas sp. TR449 TaxID=2708076 RepID=UPI00141E7D96|nr:MFS transporter [Diaminobutyricimonas sp. TR449]
MSGNRQPVPSWRLVLSIQAVLVQAVWVGVRLMVGYSAIENGADAAFIALLAAALAAPALFAAIPVGRLSDRIGGSVLTLVGTLLLAGSTAILIWVPGLGILLVSSALLGLGNVMLMIGQQTFVAHRTRDSPSDRAFGTLSAAASIGQLVGAPLITVATTLELFGAPSEGPDTTTGLMTAVACAVLALPCGLVLLRIDRISTATVSRHEPTMSSVALLATPGVWRAVVVSGLILVTMDLVYAFVPVWATEQGIDIVVVGWLLGLRALVSVLSRFGLSYLVGRFGRKILLIVAMGVGSISLIGLPFANEYAAVGVMIGLGVCLGLPQPLTLAWVVSITSSSNHGAALGLRMMGSRLAQVSIPIGVSAVAAPLGLAGIFWANALLLVFSSALVARSNPDGPEPGSLAQDPASG